MYIRKFIFAIFLMFYFSYAFAQDMDEVMRESAISETLREQEIAAALDKAAQAEQLSPAKSEGALAYISSHIHPFFYESVSYSDNIFLVQDATNNDVYNTLIPGVSFIFGELEGEKRAQKSFLEIDLGAKITNYSELTYLNRQKPFLNLFAEMGKSKNRLCVSNQYRKDAGLSSSLSVGQGGLSNYSRNFTDISWISEFNKLGFEIGYQREYVIYLKDFKGSNSFDDQTVILQGFFKAFPKTDFLLEWNYGKYKYMKSPTKKDDNEYNKFWLGARGKLGGKLNGLVKFGFEKRNYREDNDIEGITYILDLDYKLSPKTSFLFHSLHGNKPSDYRSDGYVKGTTLNLSAIYKLNPKTDIRLGLINYEHDIYATERKDDSNGWSAELWYALRDWMKLGFSYNYAHRHSSVQGGGYTSNLYSIIAEADF